MIRSIRLLSILLPALASLVQAAEVERAAPPCTISDIHNLDVAGCTCQPHHDGCFTACSTCGWNIKDRNTKSCTPGCTDNDWDCKGCGVWFSTLCDCLKGGGSGCTHTGTVKPHGPMIWVLLPKGEHLITTTDLLPGILEMANDASRYEEGWDFAQKNHDPSSQALALNSVRSRTHEQFHIHICPKPTSKDPRAYGILSKAALNPTNKLKAIAGYNDLFCMSVEKGKGPIKGFATAIHDFLGEKKVCDGLAGAGIIRDAGDNTWACVTSNKDGPLAYFCA
ncbi:hypothetical protein Trco_006491 [Trichoderma cornu-damae]|uniref:CDP-diglyceride hydrolase n=1 Tax=Trichoderma cornu-damae TaxID=654480 RepID=A0A9P8QH23_9HYPO|nr:hypothetical protein Trco_006491 [Trichoderma cornu-damae]